MKKLICILFIFTILLSSIFADKSRFYENGKVIDTMYVNSVEGLRIRKQPDLFGEKICVIPHMIQIKVVAIGKEVTLDGITAPWVEILIPRYEWKDDKPEYGWVFGGYLSNSRKLGWKKELPLEMRLQIRNWGYDSGNCELCSIDFCTQGFNSKTFTFFYKIRGDDESESLNVLYTGKWNVKGDTIFFEGTHSLYQNYFLVWEEENFKTQLDDVGAYDMFTFNPFPLVTSCDVPTDYGYRSLLSEEQLESVMNVKVRFFTGYINESNNIDLSKPCIYYNAWSDYGDERDLFYNPLMDISDDSQKKYVSFVQPLIEAGVDPRGSDYMKEYRAYWDPIMKKHQKIADKMK